MAAEAAGGAAGRAVGAAAVVAGAGLGEPGTADRPLVLLVTGRDRLVQEVAAVAAAVGAELVVRPDLDAAGGLWVSTPRVLLGDDAALLGVPARRPGVALLALGRVPDRDYRAAVDVGAEQVLGLPEDAERLVDLLLGAGGRTAVVLAVVGGSGGAGASCVAAGLALEEAAAGGTSVLVDLDSAGAGAGLLLDGGDGATGLGWPDLDQLRGALRGSVLLDGLPVAAGVHLLGWPPGPAHTPPPVAVESVLTSLASRADVVVLDLPRHRGPASWAAATAADAVLLVVRADLRSVVAASRTVPLLAARSPGLRLLVRRPRRGGLDAQEVAEALGLGVQSVLGFDRDLVAAVDRGDPPARSGRLRRCCRQVLADVRSQLEHPAAGPVARRRGRAS